MKYCKLFPHAIFGITPDHFPCQHIHDDNTFWFHKHNFENLHGSSIIVWKVVTMVLKTIMDLWFKIDCDIMKRGEVDQTFDVLK